MRDSSGVQKDMSITGIKSKLIELFSRRHEKNYSDLASNETYSGDLKDLNGIKENQYPSFTSTEINSEDLKDLNGIKENQYPSFASTEINSEDLNDLNDIKENQYPSFTSTETDSEDLNGIKENQYPAGIKSKLTELFSGRPERNYSDFTSTETNSEFNHTKNQHWKVAFTRKSLNEEDNSIIGGSSIENDLLNQKDLEVSSEKQPNSNDNVVDHTVEEMRKYWLEKYKQELANLKNSDRYPSK